jgi:predicted phosphodiesterase
MNKFLCVGDIHFKKDNSIESEEFIYYLLDHIKKNEYDFIVLLGDILDTFENTYYQTYNRVYKLFNKLNKICKTFVLIGNHDRPNNDIFLTNEHFFNPFKKYDNIIIVDKPLLFSHGENNYIFMPYVSPGRFNEALNYLKKDISSLNKEYNKDKDKEDLNKEYNKDKEDLNKDKEYNKDKEDINKNNLNEEDFKNIRCIFAHQEIKGCKMGMLRSEIGDIWDEKMPPIISGHIHEFHIPQINVFYVPTPFQHGFSDETEKFICIFKYIKEEYKEYIKKEEYKEYKEDINIKKEEYKEDINIKKDKDKEDINTEKENKDIFCDFIYEKVKLDIKRKRIIKITLEELKKYEENDNFVTKIIVEGNSFIIREHIKQNEKYKNMKIQIKDNTDKKKYIPKEYDKDISLKKRIKKAIKEETEDDKQEYLEEFKRLYT